MTQSRLLDRVVKLFRLGSAAANTTEAEMMSAMTAAKRLMADHNIALADVLAKMSPSDAERAFAIYRHTTYTRKMKNFAVYDTPPALAAGVLTGTRPVHQRTSRGGSIWCSLEYIGVQADCEIAGELFHQLIASVRRAARDRFGPGWSTQHTSYAVGFGSRLHDRAREEVKGLTPTEETSMALVVRRKEDAIAEWMRKNAKPEKRRSSDIDPYAYSQGYQDGQHLSLGFRKTLKGTP